MNRKRTQGGRFQPEVDIPSKLAKPDAEVDLAEEDGDLEDATIQPEVDPSKEIISQDSDDVSLQKGKRPPPELISMNPAEEEISGSPATPAEQELGEQPEKLSKRQLAKWVEEQVPVDIWEGEDEAEMIDEGAAKRISPKNKPPFNLYGVLLMEASKDCSMAYLPKTDSIRCQRCYIEYKAKGTNSKGVQGGAGVPILNEKSGCLVKTHLESGRHLLVVQRQNLRVERAKEAKNGNGAEEQTSIELEIPIRQSNRHSNLE